MIPKSRNQPKQEESPPQFQLYHHDLRVGACSNSQPCCAEWCAAVLRKDSQNMSKPMAPLAATAHEFNLPECNCTGPFKAVNNMPIRLMTSSFSVQ